MCRDAKASDLLQDLRSLATNYAVPGDALHNVAANGSTPEYTLFPHADLQSTQGMPCPVFPGDATTAAAVGACSSSKNGACCVNYDDLQLSPTAMVRHVGTEDVCV